MDRGLDSWSGQTKDLVSAFTSSAVDRGLDSWSGQTKDLVSVFTSSTVDRGLDSWSGQTKDYKNERSNLKHLFVEKKTKLAVLYDGQYQVKSLS